MRILKTALAGFLTCGMCLMLCPRDGFGETKEALEERISSELTLVLDRYLGIGKSQIVVFVDAEPTIMLSKDGGPMQTLNLGRDKKSPKVQWLWADYSRRNRKSLLPGFSARQQMLMREETRAAPKKSAPEDKRKKEAPLLLWKVTRMLVTIILDRTVSPKEAEMVGAMAMDILGLDPNRGDKLNVYKLPFIPAWRLFLTSPATYLNIIKLLGWSVLIGLIAYALYRFCQLLSLKLHQRRQEMGFSTGEEEEKEEGEEGKEKSEYPVPPSASESPQKEKPLAPVPSAPDVFGFVNPGNARLLGELVGGWSVQTITVLVSFLGPTLGKVVLDELSPEQRENVLSALSRAASVEPKQLDEMENMTLERLRFAVGGTELVADLISQLNSEEQVAFLEKLAQKSPYLAAKVRKAIFRFEDIFTLPERDIRVLAQVIPFNEWTGALSGMPQDNVNMICRSLPQEVQKVFLQHMEFNASANGKSSEARWRILKMIRHLQVEGRISSKRNGEVPGKTLTITRWADSQPNVKSRR